MAVAARPPYPSWVQVHEDLLTGELLIQIRHEERAIQYRVGHGLASSRDGREAIQQLIIHGKRRLVQEQETIDAVAAKLLGPPDHAKK